jgi:hypothetical protein
MTNNSIPTLTQIRFWLVIFLLGLIASGVTAFPLPWELNILCKILGIPDNADPNTLTGLQHWIAYVRQGVVESDARYRFLAYGTDWLAFGHISIAVLFLPVLRDPKRFEPIIQMGVVVCALVLPLAFICGPIRGIPFYWQLIDCSFGVGGSVPLLIVLKLLKSQSLVSDSSAPAAWVQTVSQ